MPAPWPRCVPTEPRVEGWPWTSCATRRWCSATSTGRTGTPSGSPAVSPARSLRPARRWGRRGLPAIRLHDLRHTYATLLLAHGVPVKVVSERLGHASATITLTVHQHVHPGLGREAAERFAALLEG
jgi:integrase